MTWCPLPRLTTLRLQNCAALTPAATAAIVQRWGPQLRALDLMATNLGDALAPLAGVTFPHLKELVLCFSHLKTADAQAVFAARMPALQRLNLAFNHDVDAAEIDAALLGNGTDQTLLVCT